MGIYFPPFTMVCRVTVMQDGEEEDFAVLQPKKPTNLYFTFQCVLVTTTTQLYS